jgi:hypothetical protein
MAFEKYYDQQLPVTQPACIHLRSKAMYVTGSLRNPDHPDEAGSQYCWCNRTQHTLGPDHEQVARPDCISGRECYQDTY